MNSKHDLSAGTATIDYKELLDVLNNSYYQKMKAVIQKINHLDNRFYEEQKVGIKDYLALEFLIKDMKTWYKIAVTLYTLQEAKNRKITIKKEEEK